ncbi:hypothetical protein PRIPAC_79771 [Pristionchus pacificus]|nr:hypothetical protein PRIPAC_79771 [Pristionchus pacificus]
MRSLLLLLFCLYSVVYTQNETRQTLTLGLLFTRNSSFVGYKTSAAAVLIARDRIIAEDLFPNINLEFTYFFDDCIETRASGYTVELILKSNVSALIGPCCNLRE